MGAFGEGQLVVIEYYMGSKRLGTFWVQAIGNFSGVDYYMGSVRIRHIVGGEGDGKLWA